MNVSRRWLEAFLRRPLDARDLADRLAMLGATVDAIEPLHADLADIRVALVEEVRPHPNADRLQLCTVNDGTAERRNVVCGASNVASGHKYPFAPVGAVLPGGLKIEKRKIRGEVSQGMLCSARELGVGTDHEGIWELETDAAPGTPLLDALSLADERLVLDVTPNRPDLLGHKGVARELSASLNMPFRLPVVPGASDLDVPPFRRSAVPAEVGGVSLAINDPAGCPRFLGAVIRGVRVAPSPDWLRQRLEAVGVRAINNVVDATNYVMFELNQPMHAYDVATLRGPGVVARRAQSGERLVTLDGVERTLDPEMVVIADAGGAIGVAGVMGGSATEVSERTTDVFLECAFFDPIQVRRARRALNLSTEASHRFERGTDRWNAPEAMRRCIELVITLAGGALAEAPLDLWPQPSHPPRVFLRLERLAQVLGVQLPLHTVERHLVATGATVVAKPDDARIAVDVPGWRPDLVAEIDLIEEVARLYGYDALPTELRRFRVGSEPDAPIDAAADRVRRGMVARGLFEVVALPFGPSNGGREVPLVNPLSAEHGYLRGALLPGLVRMVEANWANRVGDVRLFEIGTVFAFEGDNPRPREECRLAAVVTGAREPAHWSGTGGEPLDLWDLKGLFEAAVALANPDAAVQVEGDSWIARAPDGTDVGRAAEIAADAPPWAAPVYGLEVTIAPTGRQPVRVRPLPVTPASERDVALLLPEGVTAAQVDASLRGAGGTIVESVGVLDEYRGPGVPAGVRSVAFRLTFRAPDRTLSSAEVDAAETRMLEAVRDELGVHRRDVSVAGAGE